jgi:hypothetical protein
MTPFAAALSTVLMALVYDDSMVVALPADTALSKLLREVFMLDLIILLRRFRSSFVFALLIADLMLAKNFHSLLYLSNADHYIMNDFAWQAKNAHVFSSAQRGSLNMIKHTFGGRQ